VPTRKVYVFHFFSKALYLFVDSNETIVFKTAGIGDF